MCSAVALDTVLCAIVCTVRVADPPPVITEEDLVCIADNLNSLNCYWCAKDVPVTHFFVEWYIG